MGNLHLKLFKSKDIYFMKIFLEIKNGNIFPNVKKSYNVRVASAATGRQSVFCSPLLLQFTSTELIPPQR